MLNSGMKKMAYSSAQPKKVWEWFEHLMRYDVSPFCWNNKNKKKTRTYATTCRMLVRQSEKKNFFFNSKGVSELNDTANSLFFHYYLVLLMLL